jgi:aminopeptidase YwaD
MVVGYEIRNRINTNYRTVLFFIACTRTFVQILYMNKWIFFLLLVPITMNAQSKKKKAKMKFAAEQKVNAELMSRLTKHVQYLAHDSLEGRRTGTKGEELAMQYIANEYSQAGIEPKGINGYIQPFEINEGKRVAAANNLSIYGNILSLNDDYFPLAFSKNTQLKASPAIALREKGQPWFLDLKDELEAQKNNPHFDVEDYYRKQINAFVAKGATAVFIYNSSTITDNVLFNKNDTTALAQVPVIYLKKPAVEKYCKDKSATLIIELTVAIENNIRSANNVVAFINNNAPTTIILGAHYDHLGFGEDKNALDALHEVHNGADDNASGTAALIELAKLLKQSNAKNNNYLFINFSGEELGLFGSKYWIANPTINITPNYMINMDMVGRYDTSHKLTIGGYGTSPIWGEVFTTISNKKLLVKYDSTGSGPSDHASFYRAGIPVLFFFTGSHSDYHKTTDDWDKINYDAQKDIVQLIYSIIETTNTKGKLIFTKTTEPQMGKARFSVSLGVIPDYGYSGTGVKIEGVSAGKLAEKIGLQGGDILLQLGEYKFVDVNSYMQTLGKFKKGDATKLKIKRGTEEKEFDIVF